MPTPVELYQRIGACQDCEELVSTRTKVVPGEGDEKAQIVFIGEAPGYHEDQQGRPFVGQAGQFLDYLLNSINLKRSNVYICNVIKCRPPGNRDPLPIEIANCQKWLDLQLEMISPKMVVTLGRYSLAKFFPGEAISKIHGKERRRDNVIYFPMYHPAAALHQQSLRQTIEADMQKIPSILAQPEETEEEESKPQQLSMF
ncbi:MAG: uracil-DNA glycosylase [Dehalococcoidia bacterium]